MLETIRRYWVALLVLVLVGLHASIVGIIRHQASLAKVDASCEVDLGQYLAYQLSKQAPLQMRIHAIVPLNHRMKSRQLIELNQAQIRQSIEEHLRQLDSKVLTDPYLADLKSQLMEVMIQTVGDSSIDDLVITEVRETTEAVSLQFVAHGNKPEHRKMVATLRSTAAEPADEAVDESHVEEIEKEESAESAEAEKGHGKEPSKESGKKAGGHGGAAKKAEAKPAGGHGAEKKKPAKKGH
jgi:hypothetical protein